MERQDWINLKPIYISIYTLSGFWFSLGIHISIIPLYFDIHLLWWTISVMGEKQAKLIKEATDAYCEKE